MSGTGSLPGDDALEREARGPGEAGEVGGPAVDDVDPARSRLAPEETEDGEAAGDDAEPGMERETDAELPDAPLFALLRNVQTDVGVDRIDRIWLFPPRRLKAGETAVVVVAAYPETDQDRRRIFAAHYTAPARAEAPRLALEECGSAPADRVGRMVEDVVERFKDDAPPQPPRPFEIRGDDRRWNEMLFALAEEYVDAVTGR